MRIGQKIKNLRLEKGLTQEELGERTDLTKGYISQIEHDLSSPSIETFFTILEVLGSNPKNFFNDLHSTQKVVYTMDDRTDFRDQERGCCTQWLVPESNEKIMEPIRLIIEPHCAYKRFEPSTSETFAYVLKGCINILVGKETYTAKEGDAIYYHATEAHQLINPSSARAEILLVATESYL